MGDSLSHLDDLLTWTNLVRTADLNIGELEM